MRTASFFSAVTAFAFTAAPLVAHGQMGATLPGKWRLSGGWTNNAATANVRLDSPRFGLGTSIDLEDDLGFASTAGSVYGSASWQFAKKHRLDLSYNNIDRTSIKTINRQITIADQTYAVNAKIGATFKTQFLTLGYRYALYRRTGFEIGPSVAIPVLSLSVGAGVKGASGEVQKVQKDVTVPPPLPGLYFSARFHSKFYLQGNAQYMKASLFGVTVDMADYRVSGVWLPTSHVGGGISWSGNKASLASKKADIFEGKMSYAVYGPSLFLTLTP